MPYSSRRAAATSSSASPSFLSSSSSSSSAPPPLTARRGVQTTATTTMHPSSPARWGGARRPGLGQRLRRSVAAFYGAVAAKNSKDLNLVEAGAKDIGGMDMLKVLAKEFWPRNSFRMQMRVVVTMILLLAMKVLGVYIPVIFSKAIDALAQGYSAQDLAVVGAPVALLFAYGIAKITTCAFDQLRSVLFAKVSQEGVRKMSKKTLDNLLYMDYSFHTNRQSGALSKAIDRGHKSLDFVVRAAMFYVFPTLLETFLVANILGHKSGALFSAIATATMTLYVFYSLKLTEWRTKFYRKTNELENQASAQAFDSLLNFETVKYFGNEKQELKRYDAILKDYQASSLKTQTTLAWLNLGQNLIFSTGLTISLILSAKAIMDGTSTIGDITMIQALLMQLSAQLGWVGSLYRELKQGIVDMSTIFKLRTIPRTVQDEQSKDLEVTDGAVRFKDVRFGYKEDRELLKGVDLDIPGGSKVAIVGSTGSGKSTLLKLLIRFFDPWRGSVEIDGQNTKDVSLESLRNNIGVVPQDVVLFNDDIFYNIKYGNINATDEEVFEAAKAANIHDAIMRMPEGYKTRVGERGIKLSGGEKQRLGIARLLLKNPRIVVFDEATSSLDMQTEKAIMDNLAQVTRKRTTLMVAHRLETIKDADKIFVIQEGHVAQVGNHKELLRDKDGLYFQLWSAQKPSEDAPSSSESPSVQHSEVVPAVAKQESVEQVRHR
uniref:Uncharacterized protein n=1 Tax=Lotharella globosa TaxID=91324 RepID=A0A7S3YYG5_9EUKA